jgi:hypothetical protein
MGKKAMKRQWMKEWIFVVVVVTGEWGKQGLRCLAYHTFYHEATPKNEFFRQ